MTKLPEPVELSSPADERAVWGYTESQMLQFRRDALEEALNICSELAEIRGRSILDCSIAISKLMETT
jgi:hypothetical protein